VRAEPDDRHDRKQHERSERARCHTSPLAPGRRRQHHEREHQPGRGLDAHARREHGGGRPQAWRDARREREGARQYEQHERVVVGAAHRQLEQHRVQAHEHRRRLRRAAHPARGARREGDRPEAGRHCERLERPQAARQPELRKRIGAEREQGSVRRVLEGPADEREHRVGRRFRRHVRVGVEAVQHAQARKRQVPEHVLGDEWRSQQQHHIRRRDRQRDRPAGELACGEEHGGVARAHDERQRLEAARSNAEPEAVKRAGQPGGPTAAAGRHIRRGTSRRARHHPEHAHHHAHQARSPECAQCEREARGAARRRATVHRGR
jgi:hypothetical protein